MLESSQRLNVAARLQGVPAASLALAALVALNLMWGGSIPATKLALVSFGPYSLAAARLLLAGALFVGFLGPAALRRIPRGDALRMLGLGTIGFAGVQVFQAVGTGQTSGATATVLASTAPLWIVVLASTVLRERLRLTTLLGVVLALVGVVLVTGGGAEESGGAAGGNLIVLLSSVSSAVYTVLGKGLLMRYAPLTFCAVSCLGGALASVPLAAWELSTTPFAPDPLGVAMLAYLALLVTFVGFFIWFWGLRALPAGQAGALMFLQPVSGLALAALILGERLTPGFVIGCALVLVGVFVAVRNADP